MREEAIALAVRQAQAMVERDPEILVHLPAGRTLPRGRWQGEWQYTFLRSHRFDRVFNEPQMVIGSRSNRRKTHLVAWRAKYGLTDRLQPEAEVVYAAYRQHTHGDGDRHDRNDDGDVDRLFAGLSYQAVQESESLPAVRVRSGILLPHRAETEGIGQELGFETLTAASKSFGAWRLVGTAGFAMTFDNYDHPADAVFTNTPISKGHDLRTFTYGVGLLRPFGSRWQANLELAGRLYDIIELNERRHRSELAVTPGFACHLIDKSWDVWLAFSIPVGLTHDTPYLGIALRTITRF